MSKDYAVKELPWQRGSRRRLLGRFERLNEAWEIAEAVSQQGRAVQIELHGLTMATFLNGAQLPPSSAAAVPPSAA